MTKYRKGTEEWKEKSFEECKQDIAALEGNPFIKDAAVIQAICYDRGVDVGVGLDMYINENYTQEERKDIDPAHIKEYKELCRKYYLDYIVEVQASMRVEK